MKSKRAERLIIALDRLISISIDKGERLSYSAIAKSIDDIPQTFTDIKSGKKDIDIDFIQTICKKYLINQEFVLNGKGKIFSSDNTDTDFDSTKKLGGGDTEDKQRNMTEMMITELIESNRAYRDHISRQMTVIENLSSGMGGATSTGRQSKAS